VGHAATARRRHGVSPPHPPAPALHRRNQKPDLVQHISNHGLARLWCIIATLFAHARSK
jgi:hypothetical protein